MSAARRLTSAQAQVKQKRGILSALSFSSDQPSAQLSPVEPRRHFVVSPQEHASRANGCRNRPVGMSRAGSAFLALRPSGLDDRGLRFARPESAQTRHDNISGLGSPAGMVKANVVHED
jgi:hypothetical protein